MLTCKQCKGEASHLNFVQANLLQSPIDGAWVVDLILACPHCGQQLNLLPEVMDFEALEAPDETEDEFHPV